MLELLPARGHYVSSTHVCGAIAVFLIDGSKRICSGSGHGRFLQSHHAALTASVQRSVYWRAREIGVRLSWGSRRKVVQYLLEKLRRLTVTPTELVFCPFANQTLALLPTELQKTP